MKRRGWRATVGVLSVIVLCVSGPVPAGTQPAEDLVVVDLAVERGIGLAEAKRRIGWQSRGADLDAELRRSLGDGFGGVWIDPADGDRVKVGVVARAAAASTPTIRSAVAATELADAADTVPVRYSYVQLERINRWLGDQLASANAEAPWPLSAGLRPDLNAVRLGLPRTGTLTAAQQRLVDDARRQYGDAILLAYNNGKPRADQCDYPFCDPPLRAGIRIEAQRGGPCTGGFLARSRSDGRLFQFTAGHCVAGGNTGDWVTEFVDGSRHTIGPVHNHRFSTVGDMAILRVNNPAGWDPMAWVFVTAGPDTTRDESYGISADNTSMFGQRVCVTGAAFGRSDCGNVTELGMTWTYNGVTVGGLGRANYCRAPGDSGAPVYASHTAYGIHVASVHDAQCDALYQGIRGAEDLMNVNVAHGPA